MNRSVISGIDLEAEAARMRAGGGEVTAATLAAAERAQLDAVIPAGWSAPLVLPADWIERRRTADGAEYVNPRRSLAAIISAAVELDGRGWIHLSISHRTRLPTWGEYRDVKEMFLGDREAYQVIPPRSRYVNIHPNVLHAFALVDGGGALPDFTQGTGSL